ncbi:MAG TPA: hypothetical protein VHN38_06720, partial [Immundisolibacter sp.]|nr:hypothetical protein [Immundisolibacter sp.]
VVTNIQQRGSSKPRTLKTLTSTINSLFQKQLSDEELVALVKGLQSTGFVTVTDTKVTYALPSEA